MLTRDQLLKSALTEIELIKFLAGKIPADRLDYRPSEKQRSLLELLQYLSGCGIAAFELLRSPKDRREEIIETYRAESRDVTLENIEAAMDRQAARLDETISALTEEELANTSASLPWGEPCTLAELFLNTTIKFLVAYRMQLFLYLKALGMSDLGTLQAWVGVDTQEEMKAKYGPD